MRKFNVQTFYGLLPLLALASIPFGRSVEIFVAIMALIGLIDVLKNKDDIRQQQAFKLFTLIFLLFWLPAIASIPDAFSFERTLKSVLGMIRFYFVGVFIINRIRLKKEHYKLALGFAAIVSFWAVDGWIQSFTGSDIFGFSAGSHTSRVTGIFADNARLGLMIVPFFVISFLAIKEKSGLFFSIGLAVLLSSTIFLSGDRAAWVSLVVALGLLALAYRQYISKIKFIHILFLTLIGTSSAMLLLNSASFQKRLNSVEIGFDGGYEAINKASSSRLPLWSTAFRMFESHPFNGVGVRSFRYAYPDYASESDPFVDFSLPREKQKGQTHAHQVVLEFATDTGLIGVIGYLVVLYLIYFRLYPLAYKSNATFSTGYLIAVAVALFPINTHQSFFSSHWGQIVWMLIALSISALAAELGNQKLTISNRKRLDS